MGELLITNHGKHYTEVRGVRGGQRDSHPWLLGLGG